MYKYSSENVNKIREEKNISLSSADKIVWKKYIIGQIENMESIEDVKTVFTKIVKRLL